jgi:hypothetical protein
MASRSNRRSLAESRSRPAEPPVGPGPLSARFSLRSFFMAWLTLDVRRRFPVRCDFPFPKTRLFGLAFGFVFFLSRPPGSHLSIRLAGISYASRERRAQSDERPWYVGGVDRRTSPQGQRADWRCGFGSAFNARRHGVIWRVAHVQCSALRILSQPAAILRPVHHVLAGAALPSERARRTGWQSVMRACADVARASAELE